MESGGFLRVSGQQEDKSEKAWTTDLFIPPYALSYTGGLHTYRHIHIDKYTMALTPVIGQWRLQMARGLSLESDWYSSQCSRRVLTGFEASREMKVGRLGRQTLLYRHIFCFT